MTRGRQKGGGTGGISRWVRVGTVKRTTFNTRISGINGRRNVIDREVGLEGWGMVTGVVTGMGW